LSQVIFEVGLYSPGVKNRSNFKSLNTNRCRYF
jgi:hypothetical protein